MRQQMFLLCLAIWMTPIATAGAANPHDPGRIYDAPPISGPRMHPSLVGQYVRVSDGKNWQVGTVGQVARDSLVLRQTSSDGNEILLVVPKSSIRHIQVRNGTESHAQLGALMGGLLGLMSGIALGSSSEASDTPSPDDADWSIISEPVAGGLIGFCLGVVVGNAIGSAARTDRWYDVDTEWFAIGAIARPKGQLALGVTVKF